MEKASQKSRNIFLRFVILGCISAIFLSFYFFYFDKSYNFIVEVSCNPSHGTCFQRDCTIDGNCPPNNLSTFKRYSLSANDFKSCANEDCTNACESGAKKCKPIACTENLDIGETCTSDPIQ